MPVRKSRVFHWKRYKDVIFSICIASLHYIVHDISIPHEHLHGHFYIVHITRFLSEMCFYFEFTEMFDSMFFISVFHSESYMTIFFNQVLLPLHVIQAGCVFNLSATHSAIYIDFKCVQKRNV